MGSTVASECLSEYMTALKSLSYQLVTASLRLIAEVLGLGLVGVALTETDRRLLDQLVKTRRTTKSRLVRGWIRREGQQVVGEHSASKYHQPEADIRA